VSISDGHIAHLLL